MEILDKKQYQKEIRRSEFAEHEDTGAFIVISLLVSAAVTLIIAVLIWVRN